MTEEKTQQVGRLALRLQGEWWVGYWALPGTMVGAVEIARIKLAIVQDVKRKQAFMALLRGYLDEVMTEGFGHAPDHWDMKPAPENERSDPWLDDPLEPQPGPHGPAKSE